MKSDEGGDIQKKVKGFSIKYTSSEACETDKTKKFTFTLTGVCNDAKKDEDVTAKLALHNGEHVARDCDAMFRVES